MLIGLHDAERDHLKNKTFPNYALMKISAWHKIEGNTVEWWDALNNERYNTVYSSKVFDFTPENPYLPPDTIKGGTGYDVKSRLVREYDLSFPDYSIYPECDYAIGYITRGCPNNCRWCVVPAKEGGITAYRSWRELIRPDSNKLVLMDNNILACEFGQSQLADIAADGTYYIDLNQGMDARLVTPDIAVILAKIKWLKYMRFSCDTAAQIEPITRAVTLLAENGVKPYKIFIYLLVTSDVEDAAARVDALKKLGGLTIYAQAERNERLDIRPNAEQLEFAQRYVYSGSYRSETWAQYCHRHEAIKNHIQRTASTACGTERNGERLCPE
jgi:hypothetical protein